MNADIAITRYLLRLVHTDVRKAFPKIKNVNKIASTTRTGRGQYFVQISVPGMFLNYDCNAYNAYEARYKAWHAWLGKYGTADDEVAS